MTACKVCGLKAKYEYVVAPHARHPYCSGHLPRSYRNSPILFEIPEEEVVETVTKSSKKKKATDAEPVEVVEEQAEEVTEETL